MQVLTHRPATDMLPACLPSPSLAVMNIGDRSYSGLPGRDGRNTSELGAAAAAGIGSDPEKPR